VLPIVLKAAISEGGACFNSDAISCERNVAIPDFAEDDCELCEFLSILRFDLRGLPVLSTDAVLGASTIAPENGPVYSQSFSSTPLTNWTGGLVRPQGFRNAPASIGGSPAGQYLQVVTTVSNSASFTYLVPPYTQSVQLDFYAFPLSYSSTTGTGRVQVSSAFDTTLRTYDVNVSSSAWVRNTLPELVVTPGDIITIRFSLEFASAVGTNDTISSLALDNVVLIGKYFNVGFVRNLPGIGGGQRAITVLRNCRCNTPQQYWLRVSDVGIVSLERNVECCGKECTTLPFTRILCLNLSDTFASKQSTTNCLDGEHPYETPVFNPPRNNHYTTDYDGCGYSIRNRVTVKLLSAATGAVFRTIAKQGGYDGCFEQGRCTQLTNSCPYPNNKKLISKNGFSNSNRFYNGNSWYTVLALPYLVGLNEFTLVKPNFPVDCRIGGPCRESIRLVADLFVDMECEGNAGRQPTVHAGDAMQFNVPLLTSTSSACVTPGNNGNYAVSVLDETTNKFFCQERPGFHFDIVLSDRDGVQFRGPRAKTFFTNCTFDEWRWSGPTCADCGYREIPVGEYWQNHFSVLTVESIKVTTLELPFTPRIGAYPDPRVYPKVTNNVNCDVGATCAVGLGNIWSHLNVVSLRGLPDSGVAGSNQPFAIVRFGNIAQNGIRQIHQDFLFATPVNNAICVIADPSPQYAISWGTWASNNAGNVYANCSSTTSAVDNCQNPPTSSTPVPVGVPAGAIVVPPVLKK
jgi:hypothetical protein